MNSIAMIFKQYAKGRGHTSEPCIKNHSHPQTNRSVQSIILEWNLLPWEIGYVCGTYVCGTCRMSTHVRMAGRILMDDISHVGHMT